MSLFATYVRALRLLGAERRTALALTVSGIVLALLQFAEPVLFGRVIDALTRDQAALPWVSLWAAFGFVSVAANIVIALRADRLAHHRRLIAMKQYFERVIALPADFHARPATSLIGVMLSGGDSLFQFWLALFREDIIAVAVLLVLLPTALWLNWQMGLLLVALMIVYVSLALYVATRTQTGQRRASDYHAAFSARVGDVIGNVGVVQSFNRLASEAHALGEVIDKVLAAQFPVLTWWAITTVLTRGAATITMVSLFALGSVLHAAGSISVGEIVVYVGFSGLLIARLDQIAQAVARLVLNTAKIDQFFQVLDEESTLPELPNAPDLDVRQGTVVFEAVSYRYPGSNAGISEISFEAKAGETIALVGSTGSGKTTTLGLLQRVRDPDAGRILIDGQDIAKVSLQSLRGAIGVVFQEAGLFDRSIAENIAIGRGDADEIAIRAAAQAAEADSFIAQRVDGYNALTGERGHNLSGGERQRLAIARAILKDAPILILDEATSALDTETEAKVKRALARLARGRTTFVIAHRLSTVTRAHHILVMDQGRIVERGTFADLMRLGGRFAALVAAGDFADEVADVENEPGVVTDERGQPENVSEVVQ
jgi:ATP-binding cassette subfamily B protein